MTNFKTGQFIYRVNNYEAIPYIIVGEDEDYVFAIAVKVGEYAHKERIMINKNKIQHNCFSPADMDANNDGEDSNVMRRQLEKNQKNIDKFRKLNDC